jgi:hypothetical protein
MLSVSEKDGVFVSQHLPGPPLAGSPRPLLNMDIMPNVKLEFKHA